MQEGGGDERSARTQAELGRLLAVAGGYRALASDGTHFGWLDHVRYERHVDHPDEIVVRSRRLLARRRPGRSRIKESRHYFDSLTLLAARAPTRG